MSITVEVHEVVHEISTTIHDIIMLLNILFLIEKTNGGRIEEVKFVIEEMSCLCSVILLNNIFIVFNEFSCLLISN
jgi:hypothetical protein